MRGPPRGADGHNAENTEGTELPRGLQRQREKQKQDTADEGLSRDS